jgi:hypothetical protein
MKSINYKLIFMDIIHEKFPSLLQEEELLLKIDNINNFIDILNINNKIFQIIGIERNSQLQKLKTYTPQDIQVILNYQNEYRLNNSNLANHFQMSRNTIKKWKDKFVKTSFEQ